MHVFYVEHMIVSMDGLSFGIDLIRGFPPFPLLPTVGLDNGLNFDYAVAVLARFTLMLGPSPILYVKYTRTIPKVKSLFPSTLCLFTGPSIL